MCQNLEDTLRIKLAAVCTVSNIEAEWIIYAVNPAFTAT
ncbi:hypothetical protein CRENPOLYSF2_1200007 [Crenothrix polyspora]|uniref:Uncharacterized protein n=1 Tax=Crenothrix polyspora TaxID=360316 RepID=A0A1R4GZZ8_9GAMM|nr:hypothetical protein CRENPOLYSF2_1200007 [Crenothrix polyspora]